ncbi:MAG: ROK family glucokinase [Actinomycetota bacterium]|nr:ROK family glucokinase [Actinomycetota bacterium]
MSLTIGVDIGGTKVAAGVVDESGTLLANALRDTPAEDPAKTVEVIAEVIAELRAAHEVEAIGLGAAGFIDATRSTVVFAPNLAWRNLALRETVEQQCGLPVVVENDANAAAWGESRFGAARSVDSMVMLTIGTGIGGGVVLDGALYRGMNGMAAEIGHMTVVAEGRRCGCGNRGCWERYASGRALVREARDLADVYPEYASRMLELGDGDPEGITGPEVTQAANEGDPAALEAFDFVADWLGRGMASLAALLDPGMFVLGGGVSDAGELLRGPAETAFLSRLTGRAYRHAPAIALAELGGEAGIVGAADLARRR